MEEQLKRNDYDYEHFEIEMLFKESDIEEIWNHSNPILNVYDLIETNMRKKTGKIDFDSNLLMALAEFHVNNLIYFKENFKFPIPIYCKLMNLLNILLILREDNFRTETKETIKSDPTRGNYEEEEKNNHVEPDFAVICKNKIKDLKKGFLKLELIAQDKKKTGGVANNKEDSYYLKNNEVASILDYVNTFYFPFIRLYYHFINIERITENKKIDVIINKPLPVPPLNVAVKQIQEKIQYEEQPNDEAKDENNIVNYNYLTVLFLRKMQIQIKMKRKKIMKRTKKIK